MAGYYGKNNQGCCSTFDCQEATVAYLGEHANQVYLKVGDTDLILPKFWVHPSQDGHGYWCFIPKRSQHGAFLTYKDANGVNRGVPPDDVTLENTRCVFFSSVN